MTAALPRERNKESSYATSVATEDKSSRAVHAAKGETYATVRMVASTENR